MEDFAGSEDYKRIFSFDSKFPVRLVSRESSTLEFKRSFDWNSKNEYAKSIAAFANNQGGFLVFGVENNPRELIGLQNRNFEDLDEARITAYLNGAFSPEIMFEKFIVSVKGKPIGVLRVYLSVNKPVVCIRQDGVVREAEIYYRYNASSEKIKYPELRRMLEEIVGKERESWMRLIQETARIGPEGAQIIDTSKGIVEVGKGKTLVIDEKLVPQLKFVKEGKIGRKGAPVLKLIGDIRPAQIVGVSKKVRITDDPSAPEVRLSEEDIRDKYPLTYSDLVIGMRKMYPDFKQNNRFHSLKKKLEKDGHLCFVRYLDQGNPRSPTKKLYNPAIYEHFSKHYTPRSSGDGS